MTSTKFELLLQSLFFFNLNFQFVMKINKLLDK